jgi:Flp pilus assembly secretin CpaC
MHGGNTRFAYLYQQLQIAKTARALIYPQHLEVMENSWNTHSMKHAYQVSQRAKQEINTAEDLLTVARTDPQMIQTASLSVQRAIALVGEAVQATKEASLDVGRPYWEGASGEGAIG